MSAQVRGHPKKYTEVGSIGRDALRACLLRHWYAGLRSDANTLNTPRKRTSSADSAQLAPPAGVAGRGAGGAENGTPTRTRSVLPPREPGSRKTGIDPAGGTLECKAWREFLEMKEWYKQPDKHGESLRTATLPAPGERRLRVHTVRCGASPTVA